jgi:photosystem II stability/assembly factor-like uncharacterized protein
MQLKIIITFFVIICSIGLASINDAYAAVDTWTDATTTNVGSTQMWEVSMSDASNGVAVGNSGQIVYTTNGGVDWTGSSQDVSELTAVLGIPDEQLPLWVTNLALWVSEDKITIVDMIMSIEHLINN